MQKEAKQYKLALTTFNKKFCNNEEACESFFFKSKYPTGYYCEKCGCTHYRKIGKRNHVYACKACGHQEYLFAGSIFQDNKLPLYTLLLGIFLFFNSTKGISGKEMQYQLGVNYKTALLMCRKCRILMAKSTSDRILDSMFYESDVAYIGAKSKEVGHQGLGTEKQAFIVALSTKQQNKYPMYLKLQPIPKDNKEITNAFLSKSILMRKDRTLNTDGKQTFNVVKDRIKVINEAIDYTAANHRLYWLNIIIGNVKNNILGIYHGVSKRNLPLFLKEQEYRFNHRNVGLGMLDKIQQYLTKSAPMKKRTIIRTLDDALLIFS